MRLGCRTRDINANRGHDTWGSAAALAHEHKVDFSSNGHAEIRDLNFDEVIVVTLGDQASLTHDEAFLFITTKAHLMVPYESSFSGLPTEKLCIDTTFGIFLDKTQLGMVFTTDVRQTSHLVCIFIHPKDGLTADRLEILYNTLKMTIEMTVSALCGANAGADRYCEWAPSGVVEPSTKFPWNSRDPSQAPAPQPESRASRTSDRAASQSAASTTSTTSPAPPPVPWKWNVTTGVSDCASEFKTAAKRCFSTLVYWVACSYHVFAAIHKKLPSVLVDKSTKKAIIEDFWAMQRSTHIALKSAYSCLFRDKWKHESEFMHYFVAEFGVEEGLHPQWMHAGLEHSTGTTNNPCEAGNRHLKAYFSGLTSGRAVGWMPAMQNITLYLKDNKPKTFPNVPLQSSAMFVAAQERYKLGLHEEIHTSCGLVMMPSLTVWQELDVEHGRKTPDQCAAMSTAMKKGMDRFAKLLTSNSHLSSEVHSDSITFDDLCDLEESYYVMLQIPQHLEALYKLHGIFTLCSCKDNWLKSVCVHSVLYTMSLHNYSYIPAHLDMRRLNLPQAVGRPVKQSGPRCYGVRDKQVQKVIQANNLARSPIKPAPLTRRAVSSPNRANQFSSMVAKSKRRLDQASVKAAVKKSHKRKKVT